MPQGSVLGALLFLHTNDIPLNIHCGNLVMFADAINVLITDSDIRLLKKINRVMAESETWFNRTVVVINTGKRGVILFHNKHIFW